MKIKIGEKIYRLKYVESSEAGDSLMELVIDDCDNHKFKAGDIVFEDGRIMIVKEYPNKYYCLVYPKLYNKVMFDGSYGDPFGLDSNCDGFRYATEEEKNTLFECLKKSGKRWNAGKNRIEDIPERKFKTGDKVRIKDGISSKTHFYVEPLFTKNMDEFTCKTLIVKEYNIHGNVCLEECIYEFSEDWLELDKLRVGDWVIAWNYPGEEVISKLETIYGDDHKYLIAHTWYMNAVKWDKTFEQLEKISKP